MRPSRVPAFAIALGVTILALAGGCASRDTTSAKAPLTERQRDSVLATENLPGAGVVGRALAESDRQARRASSLDSLTR